MKYLSALFCLAIMIFFSGCGEEEPEPDGGDPNKDTTAPTVSSSVPVDDATDVAITANVTVTFSEAIDIASVSSASFKLTERGSSEAIEGSYNASGSGVTLNPTSDLAPSTTYTLTLSTAITDLSGNRLASGATISFTTASSGEDPVNDPATGSDTTAPDVTSTDPTDEATSVGPGTNILVTFTEAIDPASVTSDNVKLTEQGSSLEIQAVVSVSGEVMTIDPSADFAELTTYVVVLGTGLTDLAGNALASEVNFSFTTLTTDTQSPSVMSQSLTNGETDVGANTTITVTFSEPMDINSLDGNITLRHQLSGDFAALSFEVDGNDVIITPDAALIGNSQYNFDVTVNVTDLAGNKLDFAKGRVFTTEIVPVRVVSSVPANLETGVEVDVTSITLTMSAEIDPASTTATNRLQLLEFPFGDSPGNISGTIEVNGNQITFTPSSGFIEFGTRYKLFLDDEIMDIYGNPHAEDFSDEESVEFTMVEFSELYSYNIVNKSNGNTLAYNTNTGEIGFVEDGNYSPETSLNQRKWIIDDRGDFYSIKNVHIDLFLEALPTMIGGELVFNTSIFPGGEWTITQFDDLSFGTNIYNLYSRDTILDGDPEIKINTLSTDTSDTSNQWEFARSTAL